MNNGESEHKQSFSSVVASELGVMRFFFLAAICSSSFSMRVALDERETENKT